MNDDEVYSSSVLAKGEWELLCINRIPCSLTQMHVAVTTTFESAVWKCYQLDRVSEQKEWEISAWLSRLNYLRLIRKAFLWAALCTDQIGGGGFEYSEGSGDFPELNLDLVDSFCNTIVAACIEAAVPLMIA